MTKKKFSVLASTLLLIFCSSQIFAQSKAANVVDDTAITTKIKAKLLADKLTVKVETENGIVKLSGNVSSEAEAKSAVETAASTDGVIDVDATDLRVQASSQPLTDSYITSKVKGVFLREKVFGDKPISVMSIHVETKDGIVYLSGTADNRAQIETARRLAQSVKGVKSVETKVNLK